MNARLFTIMMFFGCSASVTAQQQVPFAGNRVVTVMTQNVYTGADAEISAVATFSVRGEGGVIPDGFGSNGPGAPLRSIVTVPHHFQGPVTTVWVDFHGLQHTWPGDLRVRLIHPDGVTAMDLFSRPGRGFGENILSSTFGIGSDFVAANRYSFADNGTVIFLPHPSGGPPGGWQQGPAIPSGTYRPSSNPNPPESNELGYFFTPVSFWETFGGKPAAGDWILEVVEWANGFDTGSFGGWTLNICSGPCPERPPRLGDELLKLTPFETGFGWWFSASIGASGNTAIVGSPDFTDLSRVGAVNVGAVGSAYLFDLTTGRQTAQLHLDHQPLPFTRPTFGQSVAIDRHTALVGAPFDWSEPVEPEGVRSGVVHVFDVRDPARPVRRLKLVPSDYNGLHKWEFGRSLAISGRIAAIGALVGTGDPFNEEFRTYLFDVDTGKELVRLTASDLESGDIMLGLIDIDGHTLIVNARGPDGRPVAYVFDVKNPRHPRKRAKLIAPDEATQGGFGPFALSGDLVVAGSRFHREGDFRTGAAYLYSARTGEFLARFVSPTPPEQNEEFGASVALKGDIALIGAPGADIGSSLAVGAAYLFDVSRPRHPILLKKLTASDAQFSDSFGGSVALGGGKALVGADQLFTSGGKVLVYHARQRGD